MVRNKRSLDIWYTHGIKPSLYVPRFDPPADFLLLNVTRDRSELYSRINHRVNQMMQDGWIQEVAALAGTAWEPFLQKKKLIGYPDIFTFLKKDHGRGNKSELIATIAQKTRNYAKRQVTFWKMLAKQVDQELAKQPADNLSQVYEVNLTLSDPGLYIKQLSSKLLLLFKGDPSGHG